MAQDRATCWSITINNPIAADEENINLARQKGWNVEGQLEKGENGTPHYQLMVRTPQVRFSAVKKAFPRSHIEVARNVAALKAYVHKEETRSGALVEDAARYPSLSKFWQLVYEELDMQPVRPYELLDSEIYLEGCFSMARFDAAVRYLIQKGYHVETMGVNPQMRSCWKLYARSILYRVAVDKDRQTDENVVSVVDIPTHAVQEDDASPPRPEGSS